MIVSKNSWHCKLNSKWSSRKVRDCLYYDGSSMTLCEYFWATVHSLLALSVAIIFVGGLMAVVSYIILSPLLLMFSSFTGIWWNIPKTYELGLLLMMAVIFVVPLVAIAATLFGQMKVFPKWLPVDKWLGMAITKAVPATPKKVNILLEWIKAKKYKVCPIIEFKGE